jgi:cobalt-precorrin-5B (C1)-methyltransferase
MSTAGICDILSANTAEDACHILDQQGFYQVYDRIAQRASQRSKEREKGKLSVGTVLLSLSGRVLGFDASAERIGREFSWHLASPINYSLLV